MELDVLVVGAGPVGLMLAGDLACRRVSTRIIDVLPQRSTFVKAMGVTPRTLEVFDHIGVLDAALDRGMVAGGMTTEVNGEVVTRGRSRADLWPYEFLYLSQPNTEEILEHRLLESGGRIDRGCRLVGLADQGDGVEARIERPGGETEHVRCRWLVGCDGAHSTVRKQLNLPFEGGKYQLTFLVSDVELDWDRPHGEAWKLVRVEHGEIQNMVALIPIPGNTRRYRLSTVIGVGDPADGPTFPETPDLNFIREVVGPILPGVGISDLRWSSTYSVSHRLVSSYRTGRVLLAGDAAHIHPPIGGLGMNTGLQDAFNLGWKLGLVTQGVAGERLMASYNEERRAVGERVVRETSRRMDDVIEQKEEDEQAEIEAGTQLDVSYRGGSIVANGDDSSSLQPGDRLPWCDGLVRAGTRKRCSLIDLLRQGCFRLLAWAGRGPVSVETLMPFERVLRARLGDQVAVTCLGSQRDSPDLHEQVPPLVLDGNGTVAETLGDEARVLLVRPDGHLSWMGDWDDASVESLAAHLEEVLG